MLDKAHTDEITKFRILWANNGDAISLVYAGTGATTSSVTRNGDKSNFTSALDHGLKTITRFYINNFRDDYTQEIIDYILGNVQNLEVITQETMFGRKRQFILDPL